MGKRRIAEGGRKERGESKQAGRGVYRQGRDKVRRGEAW